MNGDQARGHFEELPSGQVVPPPPPPAALLWLWGGPAVAPGG